MSFNDWANQFSGQVNQSPAIPFQPSQPYQPQMRTNKVFVNGLNEALNIAAPVNSEMVYFERDTSKSIMYVIRTDAYGGKVYQILTYASDQALASGMVTREEFNTAIKQILSKLEEVTYETGKSSRNASTNDKNGE